MSGLYGHRSNSSASSSPPAHGGQGDNGGPNGGLVVPQPINAAKGGHGGHSHHGSHGNHGHHNHHHMSHSGSGTTNGSAGRKYQCKMCPQVGKVRKAIFLFTWSWFRFFGLQFDLGTLEILPYVKRIVYFESYSPLE